MPKRIIDGDSLWRSEKLNQVDPPSYRVEYANLLSLALANGSFEADPRLVWATVYAFNRPDIAAENVEGILAEFVRVKMLFIWRDPSTGKQWGYWIGIDRPGRLPGKSRQGANERVGATPPEDELRKFLDSNCFHTEKSGSEKLPNGNEKLLGFGFGLGLGSRSGFGSALVDSESDDVSEEGFAHDSEAKLLKLAKLHPQAHKIAQDQLPYDLVTAMIDAITLEASEQGISQQQAYEFLTVRTLLYAQAVAKWPPGEKRFIANHVRWYSEHQYRDDPVTWERNLETGSGPQAVIRSSTSVSLSERFERDKQGAVHAG